MGTFVATALGFPTVIVTLPLVVMVGYWLFVLLGALEFDTAPDHGEGAGRGADPDSGHDGDRGGVRTGPLAALGLDGVPLTVVLSLLVALAWFATLSGSVLLDRAGAAAGGVRAAMGAAVLAGAAVVAWAVTRVLIAPLRRLFTPEVAASRRDFVGSRCVIRTGRVGRDFGQAEVTAADGSSAIVQVRQTGTDTFHAGSPAMIYDYDADGEFFWVLPIDSALGGSPSSQN